MSSQGVLVGGGHWVKVLATIGDVGGLHNQANDFRWLALVCGPNAGKAQVSSWVLIRSYPPWPSPSHLESFGRADFTHLPRIKPKSVGPGGARVPR